MSLLLVIEPRFLVSLARRLVSIPTASSRLPEMLAPEVQCYHVLGTGKDTGERRPIPH